MIETAAFLEVFSKWKINIGDCLARGDPQILARIVELSSAREGISQRALQQDLKINQSRLSKLTKKLTACKWVVLRKSPSDRRVLLMTATALAKAKVDWLRKELSAIAAVPTRAAPTRRTAIKPTKGQTSLFKDVESEVRLQCANSMPVRRPGGNPGVSSSSSRRDVALRPGASNDNLTDKT